MWKEAGVVKFEIMYRHLCGWAEENHVTSFRAETFTWNLHNAKQEF
jgi:hypothetical protein